MTATPIVELDATALSQAIHAREVSCRETMQAYLARWDAVNPALNALVNRRPPEVLLQEAAACDAELAAGRSRGWLHGIPQAIKDASAAAGLPTTYGCRPLADAVAARDSIMTARIRGAGAIIVGKTNVPEFGLGSHTFNELFGVTRNAWDPARTAGGSSGGACAALAARMLPVADGSDFMGSLRNPAGWHNLFGLRPSQGLVPFGPGSDVWISQLGTEGPLARSVRDLARLLATQSGHDPRVPLSWSDPQLAGLAERLPADAAPLRGVRIGWWGDLGGHLATEPGVLEACSAALARCAAAGAQVEARAHGFDAAALWETWLTWRQALTGARVAAVLALPGARAQIKPEALWEHAQGERLDFARFERAAQARTAFFHHLLRTFEAVDLIALPTAQVWPFPVETRWPAAIAGRAMDTYHRWMECTIYATLAGAPAISVPAGFDASGRWPVGLQLIAPPRADARLLACAAAYEHLIGDWLARRPAGA
ncbi:MAG: amidase [Burkholderiales bacterium]|nr:amidase [Burkholderiales bacterium]